MNRKYNTNEIVEAGLITGIIVILMLITGYVPILNIVSTLLLPLPVTVLALRRGYKLSVLSIVIGTILVAMVFDPITAVQSAFTFGFLGLSLAYCIKNEKSFGQTIIVMSIAAFIASILSTVLYSSLILKDGLNGIYTQSDKAIAMFKDSYESMKKTLAANNMNSDTMKQYDEILKLMTPDTLIKMFLGCMFAYSMITAYVNYLVAEKVLKRLKYNIKEPIPFRYLSFDAKLGMAVVLIMFAGSLLTKYKVPAGEYMYSSSNYVLMFILTVQGIAVITYFLLERLKLPKAGVIAIIILGISFIGTFAIYLGLADLIFDFRKINKDSLFNKRGK